jgi:uncharacterized protein YdeI (YjbR/CyaY-like superfamily)
VNELELPDQQAWSDWLDAHPDEAEAWLVFAKKGSGLTLVTYVEAVEEALRRGWIDGQVKGRDEQTWRQRFTPRTRTSPWSQINRGKALALIEAGRMLPGGLAAVEAAQADGRWDRAYASPSRITVPEDLQAALDANPTAAAFWATVTSQNRYAVLYRVNESKRADTRARRIAQFVAMLERGETLH